MCYIWRDVYEHICLRHFYVYGHTCLDIYVMDIFFRHFYVHGHIRLGHLCDGYFFETLSVNGNISSLELLQFGHGHTEVNRVPMQPKPQL
jgi:hypothetical protein